MLDFPLEKEEHSENGYKNVLLQYKVIKRFEDCIFVKMLYKVMKCGYNKGYQVRLAVIDEYGNKLDRNICNYKESDADKAFNDYGKINE